MEKRIAVYAGSFDPITYGHLDIIKRALKLFDELHVVVAVNPSKTYFFPKEKRVAFISEIFKDDKRIKVVCNDGLTINYAKKAGTKILIRGLRALSDFDYEFHMSTINQELNPEIETVFIATGAKYFFINSSAVKELAKYGSDITSFVPDNVSKSFSELYERKG